MSLDIAAVITSLGTITYVVTQVLKLLFEKWPGIMLPENQGLHDNALRLIQYVVNLLLLVAVARFGGAAMFVGWHWWDFAATAMGQAVASQVVYSFGKQNAPVNTTPTSSSVAPKVLAPVGAQFSVSTGDIPEVPKP